MFEVLDMDIDSLYLAVCEHDLYDCIRTAMKKEWNSLRTGDCTNELSTNSGTNFFLVLAGPSMGSTIDENLSYSKKNSVSRK